MENFESILKRKKEIDALYRSELNGVGDIKFQENDPIQILIVGYSPSEQKK